MKNTLEEKIREEVLESFKKIYGEHEYQNELHLDAISGGYLQYLSFLIEEMNASGTQVAPLLSVLCEVASSMGKFMGTYGFKRKEKIKRG